MPTFPSFSLNRHSSVRTVRPTTAVAPATSTTTKVPYWAGTEESDQVHAATPTAPHDSQREPVGVETRTASKKQTFPPNAIPQKPVATSSAPKPVQVYTPVEGNPYRVDSIHQWVDKVEPESSASNRLPHWSWEPNSLEAHNELRPLSPGSIFANGRPQPVPSQKSKASEVLSRGIGSVRKAAGQAKRALAVSNEPKISSPVTGTFHRSYRDSHVLGGFVNDSPLDLVGIEVAQADPPRYGKPDYALANAHKADPRAVAMSRLTGEPIQAQLFAPNGYQHPTTPAAPSAPAAAKLKQISRKVVGGDDRDTVFGDVIAAAQDSSWIDEPQSNYQTQPQHAGKGKGKARPRSAMPASFNRLPAAGNPFTATNGSLDSFAMMVPRPLSYQRRPDLDKTLPTVPVPGSPRCYTRPTTQQPDAYTHNTNRYSTASLSDTLAAEGVRRASYVPGIKCADCNKLIDAFAVQDHRCGRRAAQTVDAEVQPTGPSREEVYAANHRASMQFSSTTLWGQDCVRTLNDASSSNEPDVVVDTFVRRNHTSWKGTVRSRAGSAEQSMEGHVHGGSDGVRMSNEADDTNGWNNKMR